MARSAASLPGPSGHLVLPGDRFSARALKLAVRRQSSDLGARGEPIFSCIHRLRFPANFQRSGPASNVKESASARILSMGMGRFVLGRADLAKQVRGPLAAIVFAPNFYADFCEIRNSLPFPSTEKRVVWRRSISPNTAARGNYIARLRKTCYFSHAPADWMTPAVHHVARGLRKCQDRSSLFPNHVRGFLMLRISHRVSSAGEFAQSRHLSLLFAHRIPAETLKLGGNSPMTGCRPSPLSGRKAWSGRVTHLRGLSWRP